jgi:hypothetical protein
VGSVMVTIHLSNRHPRGLARSLAIALGIRRSGAVAERIIDKLAGSNRLIIVDEAHKLSDNGLELVRELHDATGCPFLLFAINELWERIERSAGPDSGQLFSRVDIVHALSQGRDVHSGGKALFTVEDIKALFEQPPIKLSRDATRHLLDVANRLGWGSIRRCKILVRNAIRRARLRQGLGDTDAVTVQADDIEFCERVLRPVTCQHLSNQVKRKNATAKAG